MLILILKLREKKKKQNLDQTKKINTFINPIKLAIKIKISQLCQGCIIYNTMFLIPFVDHIFEVNVKLLKKKVKIWKFTNLFSIFL